MKRKNVSFYAKTIKILKTKSEKVKYASHSPWQPANSKGVVKGRQYGTKKGTRNVRKTRGEQSSDQDLNHAKAFRASLSDPSCTLSEMCRHYTEGERECHQSRRMSCSPTHLYQKSINTVVGNEHQES